jgi:hypothetical protein
MLELKGKTNKLVFSLFALMSTCKMNGFIIIISAILVISFLSVIGSQQSLQKAIAQNMTMMMGNKTTANADTLMTKIRNMGNATSGNGGSSSGANMTNASAASGVMIGNKSS